ncbi:MAG: HAMP domain-containing sensor histidine kinase [Acidimicrobiales bacterium]
MTLRAKIAIAMAILTAVTAVIVATTTYVVTDRRVRSEVDQYLNVYVQRYQGPESRQAALACLANSDRRLPQGGRPLDRDEVEGVAFQCLDRNGESIAASGIADLPVDARDKEIAEAGRGTQIRTVETETGTWRVQTVGVTQGGAIQIARDYGETNRVLSSLRLSLFFIVFFASAASALAGWLIARRSTAPLLLLTNAAEEVAITGRLDVDIPVAGRDEPGRLARSFATMLAALGQSRDQQQQLVQDAGHELRTPLTSLRTNVETLQRYPNLPPETLDIILTDLQSETRELGSLVDELVQLATDTWDDEPEEQIALDEIVERVAERTRRRTGRIVNVDAVAAPMMGRPRELTRAISNLVDNAAKFTDAPTSVDITVRPGFIAVRDHGEGVAEQDQQHIFDRFYRSAGARSKPGSGLGLAIVEQIVRSHGGTVTGRNAPDGGAVFTIEFPPYS